MFVAYILFPCSFLTCIIVSTIGSLVLKFLLLVRLGLKFRVHRVDTSVSVYIQGESVSTFRLK